MRAYLSAGADRDSILLRHPAAYTMADVRAVKAESAHAEARRILATANDPVAEFWPLRGLATTANSSAAIRTDTARVALAETLAAFAADNA